MARKQSRNLLLGVAVAAAVTAAVPPASAGVARGKIYLIEGHILPACRVLVVRQASDGALLYFRVPDTGADNSILAIGMMAFAQDRSVTVVFSDNVTTGCGTEPRIEYLRLTNPD